MNKLVKHSTTNSFFDNYVQLCYLLLTIYPMNVTILGKEQGYFSRAFEYNPRLVIEALCKIINCNTPIDWKEIDHKKQQVTDLPPRYGPILRHTSELKF